MSWANTVEIEKNDKIKQDNKNRNFFITKNCYW